MSDFGYNSNLLRSIFRGFLYESSVVLGLLCVCIYFFINLGGGGEDLSSERLSGLRKEFYFFGFYFFRLWDRISGLCVDCRC